MFRAPRIFKDFTKIKVEKPLIKVEGKIAKYLEEIFCHS